MGSAVFCKRPHIIFIIVDDLGWNDVSFHGSLQIPTPNIDALAKDGLILNNYYVQPICTPSRGALMTGKYPLRLGLQHDVISSDAPWGLSPKEKILPQFLKELGYKTHGVGKWHLGFFHENYLPKNRGYDSFFGYWCGKGDHFTHYEAVRDNNGLDLHDDYSNTWNFTGQYSTEVFTTKAKQIIQNHNTSEPLFLYLAHQAVHAGNSYSPMQAPEKYVKQFMHIQDKDRRIFAGMVSALDDSIGELFEALHSSGILNDTILVFTTDNGAAVQGIDLSTGSNWPLRGSKYNMWEGGIRGIAFIWSSNIRHLKQKVSSQLMHITDWLPTLYYAAGGSMKDLSSIDGVNQWPSLCCNATSLRDMILYNIDPVWKVEGIRKNKYKLLKGSVFNGSFDGWFDKEGKRQENNTLSSIDPKFEKKVYKNLWKSSHVLSILTKLYGKIKYFEDFETCWLNENKNCKKNSFPKKSLLEINCGIRPENSTTNCEPMENACLFDIENDPCEYHNLASGNVKIVKDLEKELDKYRSQAVAVRNQPPDVLANPKYHGYAWAPWKNTE